MRDEKFPTEHETQKGMSLVLNMKPIELARELIAGCNIGAPKGCCVFKKTNSS